MAIYPHRSIDASEYWCCLPADRPENRTNRAASRNTRGAADCDRTTEKQGKMQELRIFRSLSRRRTVRNPRVDHEVSRAQTAPMPGMRLDFLSTRQTLERQRDPVSQWRACTQYGRKPPAICVRVTRRTKKKRREARLLDQKLTNGRSILPAAGFNTRRLSSSGGGKMPRRTVRVCPMLLSFSLRSRISAAADPPMPERESARLFAFYSNQTAVLQHLNQSSRFCRGYVEFTSYSVYRLPPSI